MKKYQILPIYELLGAVFITTLIVSNIASVKLVGIGPSVLDAGTILFPMAYIVGDIITEIYGFRRMRNLLVIGVLMLLVTTLTLYVVGLLPPAVGWMGQTAYQDTLGVVWRIVLASCIAIFVGEFVNSYIMARLKILDKGKRIWRRIIGSSAVGNLLDTVIFTILAFAGTTSLSTLFTIIVTVYLIKLSVEIIVSPITIRLISRIKKIEKVDTFEAPVWSLNR